MVIRVRPDKQPLGAPIPGPQGREGKRGLSGITPQPLWDGTALSWDTVGDGYPHTDPVELRGDTGLQGIPGVTQESIYLSFGNDVVRLGSTEGILHHSFDGYITRLYCAVSIAPQGSPIEVTCRIYDVVFATLTIPDGATMSDEINLDQFIGAGHELTFEVTQVGAEDLGSWLQISLDIRRVGLATQYSTLPPENPHNGQIWIETDEDTGYEIERWQWRSGLARWVSCTQYTHQNAASGTSTSFFVVSTMSLPHEPIFIEGVSIRVYWHTGLCDENNHYVLSVSSDRYPSGSAELLGAFALDDLVYKSFAPTFLLLDKLIENSESQSILTFTAIKVGTVENNSVWPQSTGGTQIIYRRIYAP